MKLQLCALVGCFLAHTILGAEVRLLDLEPNDAQQYIDRQDTTLKYAPKIESNVPAVRFLGRDPHNVLEDIYLANQYHGQDGLGGYLYGYSVPDIAKTERKKAGGDLRGAYNYINGDGQEIKVEYWDDGHGFHQVDNVPKILPKQIEDSPEVKAAKEEHFRIWHEEAERNSRPVTNPPPQGQQLYPHSQPQVQPQLQHQSQQYSSISPLTNQYQRQKQQYPNTGPNIQYQGDQAVQYQGQSSESVNQYRPGPPASPNPTQAAPGQYLAQSTQNANQNQPQPSAYGGIQPSSQAAGGQVGQYQPQATQNVNQYQPKSPGYGSSSQSGQYQPQPAQNVNQYQPKLPGYGSSTQSGQYQPQPTQNVNQYQPKSPQGQEDGEYRETDEGQYKPQSDEEQGPPRGFFYNFDYPVGIIVQKNGPAGNVKNVYDANKAEYEKQLQQGQSGYRSGRSSSGYLYVP